MHSDIDECQISSHNCSNNAICINTEGSFNCSSCKPGYSGNGYNCSGGCLRSFIYLLRLANPCRVTVTAHTELLGPVTVPSLMRNRPPHRGLRPQLSIYEQYVDSLSSQRIYLCEGCETGHMTYLPHLRRLESLTVCRFLHHVFFCGLRSGFEFFWL